MQHCKNCNSCCDLIMLDNISPVDVESKVRRGVVDEIYRHILVPITKEEALKKNAWAVYKRDDKAYSNNGEVFFYSCKFTSKDGCSIYDKRPTMCSSYPFTGIKNASDYGDLSHSALSKRQYVKDEPAYSPTCTYVPNLIPVVNI